jgi:hypothetical protein
MRIALHVIGMLALGVAFLALFAGVQHWRVEVQGATAPSGNSVEVSLRAARDQLGENRSAAVSALDAAKRATQVGGKPFGEAHALVLQARHALQNGDAAGTRQLIEQAIAHIPQARRLPARPPQAPLDRYVGATIVDASGERIGEVAGLDGPKTLMLLLHGASREAVAQELVFGKPRRIGETLVAWTGAR